MAALYDRHWQLQQNEPASRRNVAAYDYVDEHDRLLYQVVRFEPKDFRQRRPNGHSGWEWNLDGVERVLYRLPQLIQAVEHGRRVFVVEGEKDVHALERADEVATCNAMGAGKWRDEYSQRLGGAEVVVVADRDEAGRKHAEQVRRSLDGTARSVRVVEGVSGKDAADHLAAGHGVSEFVPVRPSGPAPRAAGGSVLTRASQIRSKRVRWAWQSYLPLGYLTIQSGETKLGKSTFAAWVIAQATRGELAGQYHGRPCSVLAVAIEDNLDDLWKPRLVAADADLDLVSFLNVGDEWDVRDGIDLIDQGVRESGASIVFVDAVMEHLTEGAGGENANSATFVRRALRPLAQVCRDHHVAGLISTHPPKGKAEGFAAAYHGSGAFVQMSRSCLLFGWHPDDHDLPEVHRRRVLIRAAGNIGRDPGSLEFRVAGQTVALDDGTTDEIGYVCDVKPARVTARALLAADRAASASRERGQTKTEELRSRIAEYLADGQWHPALRGDLEADGFSDSRIHEARKRIADTRKSSGSMGGGWEWRLRRRDTLESDSSNSMDFRTLRESRAPDVSCGTDSSGPNHPHSPVAEEGLKSSPSSPSSTNGRADSLKRSRVRLEAIPGARVRVPQAADRTLADLVGDELLDVFDGEAELLDDELLPAATITWSWPARSGDSPLPPDDAPPPCFYSRHRAFDWITRSGRVQCGVCHPPVPGSVAEPVAPPDEAEFDGGMAVQ